MGISVLLPSIYLVMCVATGYTNWTTFWTLFLQSVCGILVIILCKCEEKQQKGSFATLQATRFASAVNRDLLHTLIPPNVLNHMEFNNSNNRTDDSDETVQTAFEIETCTVMFGMLDYEVRTTNDFDFINTLFAALDQAVELSGMFKYQHVSSGSCHNYIVTCPRVSSPHQDSDKGDTIAVNPIDKYFAQMVALGFDLMHITEGIVKPSQDNSSTVNQLDVCPARQVGMKVGISSGPAAGVVLGTVRRFYCIYGDTVNTAARMCKSSTTGQIRVIDETN